MDKRPNQRLMLKAARLYYEDSRTQDEIARILETSRPQVSRLLQHARREGIVQIKIVDPNASHSDLATRLASTFGLADAVVIAPESDAVDTIRRRVGQAAARYLERTLQDGDRIGVGWGRTLYEIVSALDPKRQARVTCVPLIGGLGQIAPVFQVHELARTMATAFGGTRQEFYLPALVESEEMAERLLKSADVQAITAMWQSLNVAVVGIGNVDFDAEMQMLFVNYLDAGTQKRLRQARAVGDICVRFFDAQGRPCPDAVRGIVGIRLEELQRIRRVVGVAGGVTKAEAILGALRGNHIHVLVTDASTARRVLELYAADPRRAVNREAKP